MKKSILFFFLLLTLVTQGQIPTYSAAFPSYTPTAGYVMGTTARNSKNNRDKNSPYSTADYAKGELWTANNLHFTEGAQFLFDEVKNALYFKTEDGKIGAVGSKIIDSFRLYVNDTTTLHYYKAALVNGKMRDSRIYQGVYAGKRIVVYKMPHKIYRYREYQGTFSGGQAGFEYVNRDDYFIKVGDKSLTPLKLSKKSLLQTIPNKRKELEAVFEYIDFYEAITERKLVDILKKIEH